MKKILILAAVLTFAAAVPAFASSSMQVEATPLNSYQMAKQLYRDHGGTYRMDDGSVLKVVREANKFYAMLDDDSRVELRVATPNKFISASGRTELRFSHEDGGRVVLSRPAGALQLAALAQSTSSIQ